MTFKRFLLVLVLFWGIESGYTQVQLTSNSFPVPGTVVGLLNTGQIKGSELDKSGDNQVWDFSNRTGNVRRKLTYSATGSSSNQIPNANLVEKNELGIDVYYDADPASGLFRAGWVLPNPLTGASTPVIINPMLRSIDLQYGGGVQTYKVAGAMPIPKNNIPDSIKNQFPIEPDSIVLFINVTQTYAHSASGKLSAPDLTANVVAINEELTTSYTLKVLVPIFGWQDVTSFVPGLADAGSVTKTISFWSPDYKGLVALATSIENSENYNLELRSKPDASVDQRQLDLNSIVEVFPNPGIDSWVFSLKDNQVKINNVRIIDLTGKCFYQEAKLPQRVTIHNWPAGMYIIQVSTDNGQVYFSKVSKT